MLQLLEVKEIFGIWTHDFHDTRVRIPLELFWALLEDLFHFYSLSAVHSYDLYHIHFTLQLLFKIFGVREFLPSNEIMRWLATLVCEPKDLRDICSGVIFIIDGFDVKNLNMVSKAVTNTCLFAGLDAIIIKIFINDKM